MSVHALRSGAFRTRNPGRDAETDQVRLETVRNAIAMAVADARREREGLAQRLEMSHAQAATTMDTLQVHGRRERSDEVVAARRRLAQLDAQIRRFDGLLLELDQRPSSESGAA